MGKGARLNETGPEDDIDAPPIKQPERPGKRQVRPTGGHTVALVASRSVVALTKVAPVSAAPLAPPQPPATEISDNDGDGDEERSTKCPRLGHSGAVVEFESDESDTERLPVAPSVPSKLSDKSSAQEKGKKRRKRTGAKSNDCGDPQVVDEEGMLKDLDHIVEPGEPNENKHAKLTVDIAAMFRNRTCDSTNAERRTRNIGTACFAKTRRRTSNTS